jgi:hypothetical protein
LKRLYSTSSFGKRKAANPVASGQKPQRKWRFSMFLTKKAWSPYAAGIVIGLLQIPAFLIIETALGASSSYVRRSDLGQDCDGYFAEPGDRVAERATGRGGMAVGRLGAPEGTWE